MKQFSTDARSVGVFALLGFLCLGVDGCPETVADAEKMSSDFVVHATAHGGEVRGTFSTRSEPGSFYAVPDFIFLLGPPRVHTERIGLEDPVGQWRVEFVGPDGARFREQFSIRGAEGATAFVDLDRTRVLDLARPLLDFNPLSDRLDIFVLPDLDVVDGLIATPFSGDFQIFDDAIFDFDNPIDRDGVEAVGPCGFDLSVEAFRFDGEVDTVERRNAFVLDRGVILPHVAAGTAGDLSLVSELVVGNSGPDPVAATAAFVEGETGEPLAVTIGGMAASRHGFVVAAGSTETLSIEHPGSLAVGQAMLCSQAPLTASTVFVTRHSGEDEPLAEAGIAATGVAMQHVVDIEIGAGNADTAVAIANPTGQAARLTLTLAEAGESTIGGVELQMEPRTQTARFVSQLFRVDGELRGSLRISSDTDVAVISLRTRNGLQTASLPSATRAR